MLYLPREGGMFSFKRDHWPSFTTTRFKVSKLFLELVNSTANVTKKLQLEVSLFCSGG